MEISEKFPRVNIWKPKESFDGNADEYQQWKSNRDAQKMQILIREIVDKVPGTFQQQQRRLAPQLFSELSSSSHSEEFLIAASILRMRQYQFPELTRRQILRSIFKIDPAIVTSSSVIGGLGSIELLKILQKRKSSLDHFRNSFVNLNTALVTNSAPRSVPLSRFGPDRWISIWDRMDLRLGGDVTLKEFIAEIEMRTKTRVEMIAMGTRMIYMAMMPTHRNRPQQLYKSLRKLLLSSCSSTLLFYGCFCSSFSSYLFSYAFRFY